MSSNDDVRSIINNDQNADSANKDALNSETTVHETISEVMAADEINSHKVENMLANAEETALPPDEKPNSTGRYKYNSTLQDEETIRAISENMDMELEFRDKRTRPRVVYKDQSVVDWLTTMFLAIIPGINIAAFIFWIFIDKSKRYKSFSIAFMIIYPFIVVLLLSIIAICAYFFGKDLLEYFLSLSAPSIY